MAYKLHDILLSSVVTLLLFNFIAATRWLNESPAPEYNTGLEETIQDVKHNKAVQDLGRFTLEEANKKLSAYTEKMTFNEVVKAKRWPVTDGVRYFFVIKSMKGRQIEGLFLGYLVVRSSNERVPMSWVFQPENLFDGADPPLSRR